MSCKANSTSKSIKFQPMPMAALIANLKTLPATLNRRDSSDSSDDSSSSFDLYSKKPQSKTVPTDSKSSVKVPLSENRSAVKAPVVKKVESTPIQAERASNKENVCRSSKAYRFPGVDVLPTIEASTSQPVTVESLQNAQKHAPVVDKKESARCLFPEPAKDPPQSMAPPTPREVATFCAIVHPPTEVLADSQPSSTQLPTPTQPTLPTQQTQGTQQTHQTQGTQPTHQAQGTQPTHQAQGIQPTHQAQTSVAATPSQPAGPKSSAKIQFKTINIKGKKYMVIKKLGAGGSSEVFKVLEISTSNEYAVKCVDLATDREMAQGYLNEVKLLRNLQKSDRVIKLYEYEYDRANSYLRLVMEAGETDLACFLRAHRVGAPPALVLHYWEEMLRAVQQIHQHGIVHADLKPANFLLVSGRLKLIDFGIASAVSGDATSVVRSCGKGTFSYISPEALGGEGDHPFKVSFYSDVWSLGCILYSLIYGHTPFAHLATMVKLVTIRDPNHTIAYPPVDCILPPSLITALQGCLRYDAHSRPTVTQLLQMRHLQYNTSPLPDALLDKLRPVVSQEEFAMLQKAKVYEE
ncbi:dual specificity protein kinase TTK-like [Cydia fagiglandana]|uniref:dual specificity protein kinase TTK-like n=1 Tax=Cydia fagiglandana TaxID=1458189 RepID=UPI002FEE5A3A